MKRNVLIGLLGTQLDAPRRADRWEKWRPTISLFQHEDLLFDRFDLLHPPNENHLTTQVIRDIQGISPETSVHAHPLPTEDPWDFQAVYGSLYDFAKNYPFNPDEEEYWVHITTGTHVAQICLFLLTESHHLPARLIQSSPPKDPKSPGKYAIIDLDLSRYDQIAARFTEESAQGQTFLKSGIETRNQQFNQLIEELEHVALQTRAPILLMGPTGAGKSQLARKIFELKKARRQIPGRFIEVNCATLRGDSAMSALFGHVKGSFTGALKDRAGLLKEANQGILFLDEIGELGLDEQAMLLRALEEKRFLPLGSDQENSSNFQLISGTNIDLTKAVREKRFRADLLARINLWSYTLPGLKNRKEDIEPNIAYELQNLTRESGRSIRFNKESYQAFVKFALSDSAIWSGNFRDLNASITRMATLAAGRRIHTDIIQREQDRLTQQWQMDSENTSEDEQLLFNLLGTDQLAKTDQFDRPQLAHVIRTCLKSNNLSHAGRILFQASRNRRKTSNDADRLRKYLQRFDLDWKTIQETLS